MTALNYFDLLRRTISVEPSIDEASAENETEGLLPVSPAAKASALRFFEKLLDRGSFLVEPSVAAGNDGSIGFLFERQELYVDIDFKSDGRLHYFVRINKETQAEAVLKPRFYESAVRTIRGLVVLEQEPRTAILTRVDIGSSAEMHSVPIASPARDTPIRLVNAGSYQRLEPSLV